jgi:hypothetical protein
MKIEPQSLDVRYGVNAPSQPHGRIPVSVDDGYGKEAPIDKLRASTAISQYASAYQRLSSIVLDGAGFDAMHNRVGSGVEDIGRMWQETRPTGSLSRDLLMILIMEMAGDGGPSGEGMYIDLYV